MKRMNFFLILATVISHQAIAQTGPPPIEGGLAIGLTKGHGREAGKGLLQGMGRLYFRYKIHRFVQGDVAVGWGQVRGEHYRTILFPIDHRFVLSPNLDMPINPFFYTGIGLLQYDVGKKPGQSNTRINGWTYMVPVGGGLKFNLNSKTALHISAGINVLANDNIDGLKLNNRDAYWDILIGVSGHRGNPLRDTDGDRLTDRDEKNFRTDRKNPDTDRDGLPDGLEVHVYAADPLIPDSDNDGIPDGDEVNIHHTSPTLPDSDMDGISDYHEIAVYFTNPIKSDSDGDGLDDGEELHDYSTNPLRHDSDFDGLNDLAEIKAFKTDPLRRDTDGDDINDGDETTVYKTDPLLSDTDADSLSDGDELNLYHTDPRNRDSDGGGIDDGIEVNRGGNPLSDQDDISFDIKPGEAIVLEGVFFQTGSVKLDETSKLILRKAFYTIALNPDMKVEIRGYTDNVGLPYINVQLSTARAAAVKNHLVDLGIDGQRIKARGFGPSNPVADNKTEGGRSKNRRIELYRSE